MWSLIPHKPTATKAKDGGWVCSLCGRPVRFTTSKFSQPSYNHPVHA
jgi:hypothetical protein